MKSCTVILLILFFSLVGWAPGDALADQEQTAFAHLGPVSLAGDSPSYLSFGLGEFDTFDENQSVAGQVEWRVGDKLGFVGPLAGVIANADGAVMGYVGIYGDLALGRLVLTPQTGFGAYEDGGSTDLGGVFEFISGMTLSWRLANGSLLGVRWEHISNAGLHEKNPGSNLLMVNLGLPF